MNGSLTLEELGANRNFNVDPKKMPMHKKTIFIVSLVLLLAACEENDLRTHALTVVVDGEVTYGKFTDSWAFITDDNGTVFDVQQLSNNTTTELKAAANAAKLNLTIFTVFNDGLNSYSFRTYTNLTRGQSFYLHQATSPPERQPAGTVKLSINNYSESPVEFGAIAFAVLDGINSVTNLNNANNSYSADLALYSFPKDIMISAYRKGIPVYKMLKGITANANLAMDFNDFTPAENTFLLDYEGGAGATVFAYADEEQRSGYHIAGDLEYSLTPSHTNQLIMGYPAIFKSFFTRIRKINNGAVKQFVKRGGPVTSLEFPEFSYTVNDPSIENFEMEVSSNVTHTEGMWTNRGNTSWRVFSAPNKRSVVKTIPGALREKYKDLGNLNSLELLSLVVYKNQVGDYKGWLNATFSGEQPKTIEEFSEEFQLR